MLLELLAGLVVGSALLTAVTVLLHLAPRRSQRRVPPGPAQVAEAGPEVDRPELVGRPRQSGTGPRPVVTDVPLDDGTGPLDVADGAVVALIIAMALTTPVVGEAVAAVIASCVVLAVLFTMRVLVEGRGRDGPVP